MFLFTMLVMPYKDSSLTSAHNHTTDLKMYITKSSFYKIGIRV